MTNTFGSIKVGTKTLDDAVLNLGFIQKETKGMLTKGDVYQAIATNDIIKLREISNYFYRTSGIYQRVCNYFATMYRYDWYIVPEIYDKSVKSSKVIDDFHKILNFLDNSYIKKNCADIALSVIKNGAYYGYVIPTSNGVILQELPVNFCRSRYNVNNLPAVEFNMKFFDKVFPNATYRMKVLKMFPKEFQTGYMQYKSGKNSNNTAIRETMIDLSEKENWFISEYDDAWYPLNPSLTVKFSFSNGGFGGQDIPLFINAIPAILDLDAAQDLDRRKQMQKLLKIIVQKLPMDKNGDLIFDGDEARDIHNNAVQMLRRAVGVDVLTTFADIEDIDMSDNSTATTQDDLKKVERTVYNAFGVSQGMFNTDGNLALEKSVLNDEGYVKTLLYQFEVFFDRVTQAQTTNRKKYNYRFYMLPTTQYNYKDLSKMYKEQTQIGYSKMLPQIALGHSQSFIMNSIYFENDILNLSEVMIPPLMSSTLNMEDLKAKSNSSSGSNSQISTDSNSAGRPEKADDQKSEKTIQNIESKG